MASTASQAAWLPPQGTHNISIGSSIRRSLSKDNRAQQANHPSQPLRNDFVALRYNLKPPGVANAAGSLMSSGLYASKESFQLELNAETGERHSFTGLSETKKEIDCVLFYDAATGTLVLERLDSLLSLTHQRSASTALQNAQNNAHNGLPLNRPSLTAPVVPATAFPPTPPSTSPPEYTSLPESNRSISTPRGAHKPTRDPARTLPTSHTSDKEPSSQTSTGTTLNAATTPASASPATSSSRKTPQSMSDYAQEQRRLHESSRPKRSTTSDFASEPDEETFTFGPQTPEPVLPSSEPGSSLDSSGMPSSNNALRLSDVPPRRVKRKFSDSEPDEEVLEFGRPAQEIKRAKTSSPASIISHHGTPANIVAESPSESALSPQARPPALYQSIPSRSSAAGMAAYGTKLVHGSSPLATAAVLSSNSGSEDESEDSEYEGVVSSQAVNHAVPVGDGDTEEDDFLAAALQDDAASNHSDDSSDESDYEER